MVDVGKRGKRNKVLHPKHQRQIDTLPRHLRRSKPKKFGVAYETKSWLGGWDTQVMWYETEKARDQALVDWPKNRAGALVEYYRNPTKTSR